MHEGDGEHRDDRGAARTWFGHGRIRENGPGGRDARVRCGRGVLKGIDVGVAAVLAERAIVGGDRHRDRVALSAGRADADQLPVRIVPVAVVQRVAISLLPVEGLAAGALRIEGDRVERLVQRLVADVKLEGGPLGIGVIRVRILEDGGEREIDVTARVVGDGLAESREVAAGRTISDAEGTAPAEDLAKVPPRVGVGEGRAGDDGGI